MSHQILPSDEFTTITILDIQSAPVHRVESMLRQVVLDADIDELYALGTHTTPLALSVAAELHLLRCPEHFNKMLHVMKCSAAVALRLNEESSK